MELKKILLFNKEKKSSESLITRTEQKYSSHHVSVDFSYSNLNSRHNKIYVLIATIHGIKLMKMSERLRWGLFKIIISKLVVYLFDRSKMVSFVNEIDE